MVRNTDEGLTMTTRGVIMATKQSTETPSPAQIAELARRLIRHADNIRNPAAKATLGEDLRATARVLQGRVGTQIPAETEGLVLRAIATANARRDGAVPTGGTHGTLTMEVLVVMLLEDVAYTQSRPGSWEGAGMANVLFVSPAF
jgi:hypothetical protein